MALDLGMVEVYLVQDPERRLGMTQVILCEVIPIALILQLIAPLQSSLIPNPIHLLSCVWEQGHLFDPLLKDYLPASGYHSSSCTPLLLGSASKTFLRGNGAYRKQHLNKCYQ